MVWRKGNRKGRGKMRVGGRKEEKGKREKKRFPNGLDQV